MAWGEHVGRVVETPAFFALRGDLGAGKSVLARAIARGAGVRAPMPSPTFNLVYRYDARDGITVAHLDLYRLNDIAEIWELGWRELGTGREIVVVEWPELAEAQLPPDRWDIHLDPVGGADGIRRARAIAHGGPPPIPTP